MATIKSHFVSMKDTFMSGWGEAKGKSNILIFHCTSLDQAIIVRDNARNRSDQANIRVHNDKPIFDLNSNFVQIKDINDCPHWYEDGYFE